MHATYTALRKHCSLGLLAAVWVWDTFSKPAQLGTNFGVDFSNVGLLTDLLAS